MYTEIIDPIQIIKIYHKSQYFFIINIAKKI